MSNGRYLTISSFIEEIHDENVEKKSLICLYMIISNPFLIRSEEIWISISLLTFASYLFRNVDHTLKGGDKDGSKD